MSDTATVFLVDDDSAVRTSLSRVFRSAGFEVMQFPSAQAFLDGGHDAHPGCLVLDVDMPGMTGIELQEALIERRSLVSVIFLTGHGDIHMGVRAMKSGAVDFLTKPVDDNELLDAVRLAIERNRVERQSQEEMDDVLRRLATLTPREREVLPLVVAGQMNKQVAARLGTAEKTIKVHRARVMAKLQARTLAELVHLASRAGVETPKL